MALASLEDLRLFLDSHQLYIFEHASGDGDGIIESLAAIVLIREHPALGSSVTLNLVDVSAEGLASLSPVDGESSPEVVGFSASRLDMVPGPFQWLSEPGACEMDRVTF